MYDGPCTIDAGSGGDHQSKERFKKRKGIGTLGRNRFFINEMVPLINFYFS